MAPYRIPQIEDYEPFIGIENVERIREKARKLKDLRVANFNSTYYGGGVAETIASLTLLMNSVGNFLEHDFVIVHDPHPLPLIEHYEKKCPWIWRCHIDLSRPDAEMWKYLRHWIDQYDVAIVSCPEYQREMKPPQRVFMPAINPFSIKNRQLSNKDIDERLAHYKIPT